MVERMDSFVFINAIRVILSYARMASKLYGVLLYRVEIYAKYEIEEIEDESILEISNEREMRMKLRYSEWCLAFALTLPPASDS